jgi:hypothetical protein
VDDEDLMSVEQQQLLRVIVGAINAGQDFHAAAREHFPSVHRLDMSNIQHILTVTGFRFGDPFEVVLARILDGLREAADEEDRTPDILDERD